MPRAYRGAVSAQPPEVIFEVTRIGEVQRVAVVHVASGTEVVIQAPASAALADVRALALRKLEKKLNEGDAPPGGRGILA